MNGWDRGIDSIYQAYTRAISTQEESSRRWTVLHAAAASHFATGEMIEHILSLVDGTASVPDSEGKCPLHLACAIYRPWEEGGIRALFDADPSVALLEDANGFLPFHIAAMRNSLSGYSSAESDEESNASATAGEADNDDVESLEVLFTLLISQPDIIQA